MISCGQAKQQHEQKFMKLHVRSQLVCRPMLPLHPHATESDP